jgi:hypothetical protein
MFMKTSLSILITVLLSLSCILKAAVTGEFYVSSRVDAAGSGTLDDPFRGGFTNSTYYLDLFLHHTNSNSPNLVIHILPGTYYTEGAYGADGTRGFLIQNGWKIIGGGIDNTKLILNAVLNNYNVALSTWWTSNLANIVVSDLTVNCNYTSGSMKLEGVKLFGTNLRVERVKVINFATDTSTNECFPLAFGNLNSSAASGYLIQDCEVSSFLGAGGVCTALYFDGAGHGEVSGVMRNNLVRLTSTGGDFGMSAVNGNGVTFENNFIYGASRSFQNDTGPCKNLVVRGNYFFDFGYMGALICNSSNSVFESNILEPKNNGTAIVALGDNYTKGWVIRNNTIRLQPGSTNGAGFNFNWNYPSESHAPISQFVIENNKIDSNLQNYYMTNYTSSYFHNNSTFSGSLPQAWPAAFPTMSAP